MEFLNTEPPEAVALRIEAKRIGFNMNSFPRTGALLRLLAASKPGGRLLELGTGIGMAVAWLRQGMNAHARLVTVEPEAGYLEIAKNTFAGDNRIEFLDQTGEEFLEQSSGRARFDLIFADAWPGKYSHLEQALDCLAPGGLYVIDDLLPQANWPEGHQKNVDQLAQRLRALPGMIRLELEWCSGLVILASSQDWRPT